MTVTLAPTQTMDVADAGQQFREVIDRVARREARILVEESGTPVAAIVSADDLQRLARLDAERDKMFEAMAEISRAFADVPVEELERQVALALSEARAQLRAEREAANRE